MKPYLLCLSAFLICSAAKAQTFRRWQEASGSKWQTDIVVPVFPASSPMATVANASVDGWAKNLRNGFKRDYRSSGPLPAGAPATTWTLDVNPLKDTFHQAGSVLSFAMQVYTFTGGAHGMTNTVTFNFAKGADGKVRRIELKDLFSGSDWERQLSTLVIQQLMKREGALWVENGEIREFAAKDLAMFTLGKRGVTFFFDPYAVGPYSSGSFEVTLPYAELGPNFRSSMSR